MRSVGTDPAAGNLDAARLGRAAPSRYPFVMNARFEPDPEDFLRLARPGAVVPVYLDVSLDLDTPLTAYAKLAEPPFGFLLESVEGGERWARYSFVGSSPREAWRLDGDEIRRWTPAGGWGPPETTADPLGDFERWIGAWQPVSHGPLPRFWGGAVGYFGYDTVRWLERLPSPPRADLGVPDAFMATDRVLAIDNLCSRAYAIAAVPIGQEAAAPGALEGLYEEACASLERWVGRLAHPHGLEPLESAPAAGRAVAGAPAAGRAVAGAPGAGAVEGEVEGNRTREDYEAAVERVRDYIAAGDAYQVVLSQRASAPLTEDPLTLYRRLRQSNPSPYLFYMDLDGVCLIGSSPETLVRVEAGEVTVRPIAGTRPRGAGPEEDRALALELLADGKERAEHLMLVDLGRNDVSRVARPGSVRVPRFMEIERYSHVMHIVSEVTGELAEDRSALDAFRACFPAGTLTGAPRVRAMEIIDELEPTRRGPYGGAAGYVGYGGESLDMAIVIRTLVAAGGRVHAQAGAGIVYDSEPAREWEETRHKARVLMRTLSAPASR